MPDDEQILQQSGGYDLGRDPVVATGDFSGDEIQNAQPNGDAFLMGLARDPHTIFAYWGVDWTLAFANGGPADKRVHIRAENKGDAEKITVPVEPMMGTATLVVSTPGATYDLEIGFFHPAETWNRVAVAEPVAMPPEGSAPSLDFEIATIPLHLSFQRMVDLLNASSGSDVVDSVAQLQSRAAKSGIESLSNADREVLRVMEFTQQDADSAGEVRASFAASGRHFARRVEALRGLGATTSGGGASISGS